MGSYKQTIFEYIKRKLKVSSIKKELHIS